MTNDIRVDIFAFSYLTFGGSDGNDLEDFTHLLYGIVLSEHRLPTSSGIILMKKSLAQCEALSCLHPLGSGREIGKDETDAVFEIGATSGFIVNAIIDRSDATF